MALHYIEKAKEIYNSKISFISLVDKAANLEEFIITKNKDGQNKDTFIIEGGDIIEKNEDNHYVTGIVYAPGKLDSQGEFMTEVEISKMAHGFMKSHGSVDIQHSFQKANNIEVVETWVTKEDTTIAGKEIVKGTWMATVEVQDDNVWKAIKEGKITGFSMGGKGARRESNVRKEDEKNNLFELLKGVFGISKNVDKDNEFDRKVIDDVKFNLRVAKHKFGSLSSESPEMANIAKQIEELDSSIEELSNINKEEEQIMDEKDIKKAVSETLAEMLPDMVAKALNPPKTTEEVVAEAVAKALEGAGIKKEEGADLKAKEEPKVVAKKVSEMSADDLAKFIGDTVEKAVTPEQKELTTEDLANMVAKAMEVKGVSRQIDSDGIINKSEGGTPSYISLMNGGN